MFKFTRTRTPALDALLTQAERLREMQEQAQAELVDEEMRLEEARERLTRMFRGPGFGR